MNKILFVGGNWDLTGGRSSKLVNEFSKYLDNVDLYNGGNYNDLEKILESCINYDIVIWWVNVNNELDKVRNVKDINYKTMLVTSKRNIDSKYSFQELIQRALQLKANLCIEFSKENDLYKMRLFDPLGNVWYEGTDIEDCSKELINRLNILKNITRESTINVDKDIEISEDKKEFLDVVREYASILSDKTIETKRFLGNASFRCMRGFPSFRDDKYIFVSKRNVNKEYIGIDDFVPVYFDKDNVYYHGNNKPSVDTPIQVRLYDILPNINYMIHSHCYIEDAPYTEECLPCGAIEEVNEIKKVIDEYYDGDYNKEFFIINLIGHGSIIMSINTKRLKNINLIGREIPEKVYEKKLIKK